MSQSEYVVTHRRKVHARDCADARRIAFPNPWRPDARWERDEACGKCLGTLPRSSDCQACGAAEVPACSNCGTPRE